MRYIVYGAGAIGGVMGAHLHDAGLETILIARGAHLAAMQSLGLRIQSGGSSATYAVTAAGHPSEIAFRDDDCVILTMKSQDTPAALEDLQQACAGRDLAVVCAQNGVANERMALRRFERVYGMLVILPATYLEPGIVEAAASGTIAILDAGRYPEGVDHTVERICADLEKGPFRSRPDAHVMSLKYAKLVGNLNNTLQAALGDARAPGVSLMLIEEALACYSAAGIEWASDEHMAALRRDMTPAPGRQGSSTWQSLARGTGSIETDYLNGEIVLLGRLHGVPTPANAALQRLGLRMVREGLGPGCLTPGDVMREIEAGMQAQP